MLPKPPKSASEVEKRLRDFTELAKRFSQEFADDGHPSFARDPIRAATANVGLAKGLFGKWSIEVLSVLYGYRSIGFEELRKKLSGITPRVLSQRLRTLEERGLVCRTVMPTRPARVRYSLTPDGLMLAELGEPIFLFLRYRRDQDGRRRAAEGGPASRSGAVRIDER